jgi:hypothetical protein
MDIEGGGSAFDYNPMEAQVRGHYGHWVSVNVLGRSRFRV